MASPAEDCALETPPAQKNGRRPVARRVAVFLLLCVVTGLLMVLFTSASRTRPAPAAVTFLGWTNVPGKGNCALISVENKSGRELFRAGYCETDGQGIQRRVVDLSPGSVRMEAGQTEIVQVPVPPSASGEVRFRFHVTVPRTLAQEAAEIADELLEEVHMNPSTLDEFANNRWAASCTGTVEQ